MSYFALESVQLGLILMSYSIHSQIFYKLVYNFDNTIYSLFVRDVCLVNHSVRLVHDG